jgi:hypothetical protein
VFAGGGVWLRIGEDTRKALAASKLWNVARWTCDRIWNETGTIPDRGTLKSYLKSHERYADLNAQSSQPILEELAEAFDSWYAHRENGNENANPPGYMYVTAKIIENMNITTTNSITRRPVAPIRACCDIV